ncbi:hypothetical protein K440DRAFT_670612 [Wilcoxina mikolae CBS 423.85]|nr:hypothetical protein K440DRAFT_670612 [Wilcoxina mikolae CBS 423.85]
MNLKPDSGCLIERLHDFCLEAFESALSEAAASSLISEGLRQEWKQERGRFVLWGDGANVKDGELDHRLRDAKEHELYESVVIVLAKLAYTLRSVQQGDNFQSLLAAAKHFVPEIAEFIDSEEPELKPDELVLEIKESNDSLYDLVPFLEELMESNLKAADIEEPRPPQISNLGEKFYERNILDKFPALDKTVAESLAHIN